ncbi:MAG: hypothetical protein DRJ64_01570 [Thermoprotei archaeon]|nr:MAG: hypothetical protein DRJ64_01570 [Thermoprotei archaeon]
MSSSSIVELLRTISQEVRFNILKILIEKGPLSFSELNTILGLKHNSRLSFHLNKLKEMGLVTVKSGGGYIVTEYGKKVYDKINEMLIEINTLDKIVIYDEKGISRYYSREMINNYLKKFNLTKGRSLEIVSEIERLLLESGLREVYEDELIGIIYLILLRKGFRLPGESSSYTFLDLKRVVYEKPLVVLDELRDLHVIKSKMSTMLKEFIREGYMYIWHPYYLYNGLSAIVYNSLAYLSNVDILYYLKSLLKFRYSIGEHIINNFNYVINKKKLSISEIKQSLKMMDSLAETTYKVSVVIDSPELVNKRCENEDALEVTSNLFKVLSESIFPNLLFILRIDEEDYKNKQIISSILKMILNGQSLIVDLYPERNVLVTGNLFKIGIEEDSKLELLKYAAGINMPIMLVKSIQRSIDFIEILEDVISVIKNLGKTLVSDSVINKLKDSFKVNMSELNYKNNLAFTGFHFTLKVHHSYIDVPELSQLTERFWREISNNFGDEETLVSSAIVSQELYKQIESIKGYGRKIIGKASIFDYNTVGPFSYHEKYSIKERVRLESIFQRSVESGGIFNLHMSSSSIISYRFLSKLLKKLKAEGIRWFTLTYEVSRCLSCDTTFLGKYLICPSCLSTRVLNLVRPFTSYVDVSILSPIIAQEYNMRVHYSIDDFKDFLEL